MIEIHPELARGVLESLAIGVVLVDKRERLSWVNDYAANLLGRHAEELLGQPIAALNLPYTPPEARAEAVEVRIDGAMLGITQRYEHPSGDGAVLLLLDRGHALVWFLSTLASGVPGSVASSGVLARAAIQHRLDGEVSRSRRYHNELSCISVECRGPQGPARLPGVARLLKEQLRWVDLLGQWRDDTLLVVLPETGAEAARRLQDKLAALLAGPDAALIVCGVATWERGDNAERLVARALGPPPAPPSGGRVDYLEVVRDGDGLPEHEGG